MSQIALSSAKQGQKVKVNCVECSSSLKSRLCDLGLYDGTIVTVTKNDHSGPVVLKILESQIAIGRGQAKNIMVENV